MLSTRHSGLRVALEDVGSKGSKKVFANRGQVPWL